MSENRRATRYGAFFESADKAGSAAGARKKSPARNAAPVAAPVKKEASRKSPARVETVAKKEEKEPIKKERKASKSPARPARASSKSRKASKSPARVPKKEKAPVVKKEEKEEKKTSAKKSTTKTSPKVVLEKAKKPASPKSKTAPKKDIIDVESDIELSPRPKRRTRADTAAERKSASASVSHSVVDQSPEYSDLDDPDISFKKRSRGASTLDELKEFGGTIGCLALLILYPILAYSFQYLCNARYCDIRQPNWAVFKNLSTYYNLDLVKIVIPFLISTALLNIFPLGRVSKLHTDRGYAEYHFNGLTLSVLSIAAIIGAEYAKIPIIDVIYRNYTQLFLILILKSLIQSIALIIRSRYVPQAHWNPFAKTGNAIQDFFIGREINPKLFSLIDVKLSQYHVSLITTLVLNGIFLYRNIKLPAIPADSPLIGYERILHLILNAKYEIVPLVISLLIITYVIDLLIFEHHLSKSFELQYEGTGAGLLLRYAIFPFNFSLIAKYALEYRVKLPWYVLVIISIIFLSALIAKRWANKAKHDFRLNPTSAKSLALQTIPTFQGRRLLVSGLWKIVRQPNYTAEIIIQLSLLLVLIGRFAVPPLLAIIFNVCLLIHRSVRLDERHAARYESAWKRYTEEVKYLLIPRVY